MATNNLVHTFWAVQTVRTFFPMHITQAFFRFEMDMERQNFKSKILNFEDLLVVKFGFSNSAEISEV